VVEGFEPHGWGVIELAAQDRGRALASLFRLGDPADPAYLLQFRGLDLGRRYRVTFENSGDCVDLDGFTLTRVVVPIRLESALMLELLLVEANRREPLGCASASQRRAGAGDIP
jgi:hypothetical protein